MFVRFIPSESKKSCITAFILLTNEETTNSNKWKKDLTDFLSTCVDKFSGVKKYSFHLTFNATLSEDDVKPETPNANSLLLEINARQTCGCVSHVINGLIDKFGENFTDFKTPVIDYLHQGGLVATVCDSIECQSNHTENEIWARMLKSEREHIIRFIETGNLPDHIKNLKLDDT